MSSAWRVPEIATNGTRRAGARRLILLYMRSVRREWAKFGITCAAILAIAWLALNVTGNTLLTTGPLGDYHEPDEDSINEIADYVPGEQTALYFTADVDNSGPTAATIVRITPLGMTVPAAVQIVGSLPYNSDDPGEMNQDREDLILLSTQSDPGPAWANTPRIRSPTPAYPSSRRARLSTGDEHFSFASALIRRRKPRCRASRSSTRSVRFTS